MEPDRRYHHHTLLLLGAVALAVAAVYGLLTLALREAFAHAVSYPPPILSRTARGPFTLFVVLSIGFGWATTWVAEQRGIVSPLTVVGSTIVAVGVGYLLARALVQPLPGNVSLAFVVSAVVFLGAGLVRQYFET